MGLRRRVVATTFVFACGASAFALADCKDPTEIVLEIRTDACGTVQDTGVAVGKDPADVTSRAPTAFADACTSGTLIGTLTLTPSGGKDSEIAFRVVTGVKVRAEACQPPDNLGCISQLGAAQFSPGQSVHVPVFMSSQCLDKVCPAGTTCVSGACTNIPGTTNDGGPIDGGSDGTAPDGAIADATVDACGGCKGTCDGIACNVTCDGPPGSEPCGDASSVCAPALPCNVTCEPGAKCGLVCDAPSCHVGCEGGMSCVDVTMIADSGTLDCEGKDSCKGAPANTFACTASGTCTLVCDPDAGGNAACSVGGSFLCTGGCTGWTPPPP